MLHRLDKEGDQVSVTCSQRGDELKVVRLQVAECLGKPGQVAEFEQVDMSHGHPAFWLDEYFPIEFYPILCYIFC